MAYELGKGGGAPMHSSRLSLAAFGAKGDGRVREDMSTTVSSAYITRTGGFPDAVVGNTFILHGAGAGGKDIVTTIAEVSSNYVRIPQIDEPAVAKSGTGYGLYGTNDTAAINTCARHATALNMAVDCTAGTADATGEAPRDGRTGTYICSGPLDTNTNSLLKLPGNGDIATADEPFPRRHLKFYADVPPSCVTLGLTSPTQRPRGGVTFYAAPTGTVGGTAPSLFGGSNVGNASYTGTVQVSFENLVFAVTPNGTEGTGADLNGMNGLHYASASARNCAAIVDSTLQTLQEPNRVCGFLTNRKDLEAQSVLDTCMTWGFFDGARVSDHAELRNFGAYGCVVAVLAGAAGHPWSFSKVVVHWCKYGLLVQNGPLYGQSAGYSPFNGGMLVIEDRVNPTMTPDPNEYLSTKHYAREFDLYDDSNNGEGTFTLTALASTFQPINTFYGRVGGGNIVVKNLKGVTI